MGNPTVSFIVPCYKLAHLLPECVESILRQTYSDFEILIMDDRSPDDTAAVARSFKDPRVRHIQNAENLGHLRNYNKGIALSEGKFIWLISADDYLRQPYALEGHVDVLERHPRVGYVFCPGFGVRDGHETRILGRYSQRLDRDRILSGHTLLKKLLQSNFVLTPSVLVRRECYERVSVFDLGMPWCGDWYLWCLFALHYDVAYLAEPLVSYREHHGLSMTTQLTTTKVDACVDEEIAVVWKTREAANAVGHSRVADECLAGIARTYSRTIAAEWYRNASSFMNAERFERSLASYTPDEALRESVRAQVWLSVGNEYYWRGDRVLARKFYGAALGANHWMATAWMKMMLLAMGKPGDYVRKTIFAFRY